MYSGRAHPDRPGSGDRAGHRRTRSPAAATWAAVGLAAVSAVLPGLGHLLARRRVIGGLVLAVFFALVGVGTHLWLTTDKMRLLSYAVNGKVVLGVIVGAVALALGWTAVIVSAYRIRAPAHPGPVHAAVAAILVAALSLAVSTPPIYAAHQAYIAHDLITGVFNDRGRGAPEARHGTNPWAGRPRVNVLLLGGDAGADRTGTRTDSMTVASIDTRTGDTVLFGLPRNFLHAPIPPQLHRLYPHGYTDLLGNLYSWAQQNPKLFPGSPDPGAQAITWTAQRILGLKIDYYVLVDLRAFSDIVNAIGGITIYVDKDLPIGPHGAPTGWVRKGLDHLDGSQALWYARSRAADSDYARMARQKCVLGAIAQQASPERVLSGFQRIATAARDYVRTDIPKADLPALMQLAEKAKTAKISTIDFVPPRFDTGRPDYALVKATAQRAIRATEQPSSPAPRRPGNPTPTHVAKPGNTHPGNQNQNLADQQINIDSMCRYN